MDFSGVGFWMWGPEETLLGKRILCCMLLRTEWNKKWKCVPWPKISIYYLKIITNIAGDCTNDMVSELLTIDGEWIPGPESPYGDYVPDEVNYRRRTAQEQIHKLDVRLLLGLNFFSKYADRTFCRWLHIMKSPEWNGNKWGRGTGWERERDR